MFTGIIEEIGTIQRIPAPATAGSFTVVAQKVLTDAGIGDSIAVNGVCLTITGYTPRHFTVDVMPETLRRSNLGQLRPGDICNLERAMPAQGRFGGHIVSGHIDGTGRLVRIAPERNAHVLTIETTQAICSLIVEKGSVALDGVSLTVASVNRASFTVSVIPHTSAETTLLRKEIGSTVNIENDLIGKYVQKLLAHAADDHDITDTPDNGSARLSLAYLTTNGF